MATAGARRSAQSIATTTRTRASNPSFDSSLESNNRPWSAARAEQLREQPAQGHFAWRAGRPSIGLDLEAGRRQRAPIHLAARHLTGDHRGELSAIEKILELSPAYLGARGARELAACEASGRTDFAEEARRAGMAR